MAFGFRFKGLDSGSRVRAAGSGLWDFRSRDSSSGPRSGVRIRFKMRVMNRFSTRLRWKLWLWFG